MRRLLMGEVGSGKTVVALWAMLRAVEAGHQAALMAPTETLAEQHFATLDALLAGEPLPIALLSSATPAPARRRTLERLAEGSLGLVVGTHALIEEDVRFASLGLAVVDEQHRFGVRQRAALDARGPHGLAPHVLHMTATPIPRTLSLTAYGDLDATGLRELPKGRRPVKTWVVGEEKRGGAYEFLRERLRQGRQAYVVCPLVSESAELEARAAEVEGERLAAGELRDFRVGVLHGQMPSVESSRSMGRFAAGELDVLVATSVIEVGIDVANATVMIIEGAERYGLSQLHQLRGRVGRGEHESQCILFGEAESEAARARLEAIAAERDGFKLAEVDLSIRGEGEILGTRQHGLPRFRAAELPDDLALLIEARREVLDLLERHGSLEVDALGPAHGRGPAALRRRAGRAGRGLAGRGGAAHHRGRARRPADPGAAAPARRRTAHHGAGPRGAVLDPGRRLGPARARPLRRHGRARDRGALAWGRRRRPGRSRREAGAAKHRASWACRRAATVVRSDAARYLRREGAGRFDLVLCDPPYGLPERSARQIEPLIRASLAEGGRAVIESAPEGGIELELPLLLERRYGDTLLRLHADGEGR